MWDKIPSILLVNKTILTSFDYVYTFLGKRGIFFISFFF